MRAALAMPFTSVGFSRRDETGLEFNLMTCVNIQYWSRLIAKQLPHRDSMNTYAIWIIYFCKPVTVAAILDRLDPSNTNNKYGLRILHFKASGENSQCCIAAFIQHFYVEHEQLQVTSGRWNTNRRWKIVQYKVKINLPFRFYRLWSAKDKIGRFDIATLPALHQWPASHCIIGRGLEGVNSRQ